MANKKAKEIKSLLLEPHYYRLAFVGLVAIAAIIITMQITGHLKQRNDELIKANVDRLEREKVAEINHDPLVLERAEQLTNEKIDEINNLIEKVKDIQVQGNKLIDELEDKDGQ